MLLCINVCCSPWCCYSVQFQLCSSPRWFYSVHVQLGLLLSLVLAALSKSRSAPLPGGSIPCSSSSALYRGGSIHSMSRSVPLPTSSLASANHFPHSYSLGLSHLSPLVMLKIGNVRVLTNKECFKLMKEKAERKSKLR